MNLIEKILASHAKYDTVKSGDIIDVTLDARVARDFGGANVVKNLVNNGLTIADKEKTFFTFDCNPGGSDQKYAANQHYCRQYAREKGITVYDIDQGIGTHLAIDRGLVWPGSTFVSTDSHANIMGAIGAFGQGMGDQDIAAAWAHGAVWFKVPPSVKIICEGALPEDVSAKDIVLNMLHRFGANTLLGNSVEMYGDAIDRLTLDKRITIASMATEMGAIIILFTPTEGIINELEQITGNRYDIVMADDDATYSRTFTVDVTTFKPMVAQPGHPHDDIAIEKVRGTKIDSAFIGSCTNGRIEDLRIAAAILQGKKVAPGVVLKIVPATDAIWKTALDEGLIRVFKDAGALISNAGCAGCAAGQVGQNGPGEVTISTGNRNFAGKQGQGAVYLASPATVAASAVAGVITSSTEIPEEIALFTKTNLFQPTVNTDKDKNQAPETNRPTVVEGRIWLIMKDDIDTDMIFHNRYLTITDIDEMGKYTFDNLEGFTDFASKVNPGDIVITAKNFGAGSSRQQAVDCFKSLGVSCILAESYGAIYERNAINAAMPILTYDKQELDKLNIKDGDRVQIDFLSGAITNLESKQKGTINPFYDAQAEIYQKGGLLA